MTVAAEQPHAPSALSGERAPPAATLASLHLRSGPAKAPAAPAAPRRKAGDITDLLAAMSGVAAPASAAPPAPTGTVTWLPERTAPSTEGAAGPAERPATPAPPAAEAARAPTPAEAPAPAVAPELTPANAAPAAAATSTPEAPPAAPPPLPATPAEPVAATAPPAALAVPAPIAPIPAAPIPAAPTTPAVRSLQRTRLNADIHGYWNRLRQTRPFPAWHEMNVGEIAFYWPNSFLLSCDGGPGDSRGGAMISRAVRVVDPDFGQDTGGTAEIKFTQPMIEWILSIGREVARFGQPVRDSERFDTPGGAATYQVIAMPLGDDPRRVDRILCHVRRG